jgi:thiol-disulfide isomerase/thioredoxin
MNRTVKIVAALFLFAVLALCGAGCRALAPPIKWNAAAAPIEWQSYEAGVARAKAEGKPICLVFYADWCPACKTYIHVFEDPRIVARANDFVMIHVNTDEREDLDKKYRVDGSYTPRTYFFTADNVLMKGARAPKLCFRYDYSHKNPASLLAGMERARTLASDPAVDHNDDQMAEACVPRSGDDGCAACMRAHCCAELLACANDPAACMCTPRPQGAAHVAELACLKEHCAQCPIPK